MIRIGVIAAVGLVGAYGAQAAAQTLDPSGLTHVASVSTLGHYDDAQLSFWNGQPLSATNHPSEYEDELTSQLDFYVDPRLTNQLFLIASDVRDSNFGYSSGATFNLISYTGFKFALPFADRSTYLSDYAVPGESLLGPSSGQSTPLATTPGWNFAQNGGSYSLDASSVNFGITHFTSVAGATRISNGGVFSFLYNPTVDLLKLDYSKLTASASNGLGSYQEAGKLTFAYSPVPASGAVPEPGTWAMMMLGFGMIGLGLRRRSKVWTTVRFA